MFKKLIQIPAVFCFVFIASRSNAQPASQLFTVVNGSYANASASNGNPSVTLPVLGFALDQSGGLRPLIGITGSASVGAPIGLPLPIVKATMSGNHDYILAMTGGGTWPVLLQVRGNTINVSSMTPASGNVAKAKTVRCHQRNSFDDRALSSCDTDSTAVGVPSAIDSIAVSPTGSAAALFSQAVGRIYAFTNLEQVPQLVGTFETGAIGSISAVGISDDAATVVVGGSNPNPGSLYVINRGQAPRLIASLQHPSAVQFLRSSSDAIVADDVDNKIYQVTNGQLVTLASADDGVATPSGIGISNNNQKVFVGNSASGAVTTISLNGAATQSIPCNCALTGLLPTSADSVFELTGFSGGPILLFDGSSATARTIFVPVSAQY